LIPLSESPGRTKGLEGFRNLEEAEDLSHESSSSTVNDLTQAHQSQFSQAGGPIGPVVTPLAIDFLRNENFHLKVKTEFPSASNSLEEGDNFTGDDPPPSATPPQMDFTLALQLLQQAKTLFDKV